MDFNERFIKLRKLLSLPLTEPVMFRLQKTLEEWPEEEDKELAADYIDAHLAQWGRSIDEFQQEDDRYTEAAFEATRSSLHRNTQSGTIRISRRTPKYGNTRKETPKKKGK